jgi:tetratricopeptide (TPR) repeat protein
MKPFLSTAVQSDVQAIIALVNTSFSERPDKVSQVQNCLGNGIRNAMVDGWPDDEIESAYAEAHRLFEEQRYEEVLPLALYLTVNRPLDARFIFMAGLVLQSLGDPLLGATFYATLLMLDPDFVPAAFRLAECYASVGEMKESREIFEVAIDMGRESLGGAEQFYALQRAIVERLSASN